MSGIPISKVVVPKSLGLNGRWEKYVNIGLGCAISANLNRNRTGFSEKISLARQLVPLKLAISLVERDRYCFIWEVPLKDLPKRDSRKHKNNGMFFDARYLRNDSRIFYLLARNEVFFTGHTLPVKVVLGDTPSILQSVNISIDMVEFKRIWGINF